MPPAPPEIVQESILGPSTRVIRRAEIYESDGTTLWTAGGTDNRLINGSVTIDYSRDERRAMDILLDNFDKALVHDANGGFWYDKIIKIIYGVEVDEDWRPPSIVIVEDPSEANGQAIKAALEEIGYTDVDIRLQLATQAEIADYDILVVLGNTALPSKYQMARDFFNAGGRVFTNSNEVTSTQFPELISTTGTKTASDVYKIAPNNIAHPLTSGWAATNMSTDTGTRITAVNASALAVSTVTMTDGTAHTIVARQNSNGARWVHVHDWRLDLIPAFLRVAFEWLNPVVLVDKWETQIGEFMIDQISEDNFPNQVKVTGRDYTKKCLTSKFVTATAFASGQAIEAVIKAMGQAAGVTKFLLPVTGKTLGSTKIFERGTERWKAMKEIADAYGYDLYFDAQGYLVMTEFQDPTLSPIVYSLETGPNGNLVKYSKSTNDTRVYNHIVVTGESSDPNVLPVYAEALNTEPSSPTRIGRIGDRVYQFVSSFITTVGQAQDVADKFLRIHALEEYDLNFDTITVPWLEVGQIIEFVDPDAGPQDPDRFLLSSLTIPLGLGPMSGNGKRVMIVS